MTTSRFTPAHHQRTDCHVAIIGAGPHGLSAALHLRRAGIDTRIFGPPMAFWDSMPRGMLLRSNWSATHIGEPPGGAYGLEPFMRATGTDLTRPVPLDGFVEYGRWFQREAVPDVDPRFVTRLERLPGGGFALELDGGEVVTSDRAVIACGIQPFSWRPPLFDDLPAELASHTADHRDLGVFAGRRVAVVGGGQSALESAALLHEAGADVEVLVRGRRIVWLRAHGINQRLGPLGPVLYAPTDVGPMWYSRLNATPDAFRRLPRQAQDKIAARSIRPAGSSWVRERLADVPLRLRTTVTGARADGDQVRLTLAEGADVVADHVLLGTGYRVDVTRYPFLAASLAAKVERHGGWPILRPGLETSVPGLHIMGAPAQWSFGPLMRFVSGSWYGGMSLTRRVAATGGRRPA